GLQTDLAKLRSYSQTGGTYPESEAGLIHLPQFLELLGTQLRFNAPVSLIVAGSPFYRDQEHRLDMDRGRVPSDGHLACARNESVFGCAESRDRLASVCIYFCTLDCPEKSYVSEAHRQFVTRFWSLLAAAQKSTLCG